MDNGYDSWKAGIKNTLSCVYRELAGLEKNNEAYRIASEAIKVWSAGHLEMGSQGVLKYGSAGCEFRTGNPEIDNVLNEKISGMLPNFLDAFYDLGHEARANSYKVIGSALDKLIIISQTMNESGIGPDAAEEFLHNYRDPLENPTFSALLDDDQICLSVMN